MMSVSVTIEGSIGWDFMSKATTDSGLVVAGGSEPQSSDQEIRQLKVEFGLDLKVSGGTTGPYSATNLANWRLYRDEQDVSDWINHIEVQGKYATLVFDRPLPGGGYHLLGRETLREPGSVPLATTYEVSFLPPEDSAKFAVLSFRVPPLVSRAGELPAFDLQDSSVIDVATNSQGEMFGLFRSKTANNGADLYVRRFDSTGVPQGQPVLAAQGASNGHLGMASDGSFIVAITKKVAPQDRYSYAMQSTAIRFDASGQIVGSGRIAEESAIHKLAVAGNGRFAVGTELGIYSYDAQGQLVGSFERSNSYDALLVDDAGNVSAVSAYGAIFVHRFTPEGQALTGPEPVLEGTYGGQVFKLRGARAVVITYGRDKTNWLMRVDADGTHAEPTFLNGASIQSIAVDPNGSYVAAAAGMNAAWAQLIYASGNAGEPLRLSTTAIADHYHLLNSPIFVSPKADGSMTFFWNSRGGQGSSQPVVRHFRRELPANYIDLDKSTPGVNRSITMDRLHAGGRLLDPDSLRIVSNDGYLNGTRIWITLPRPGDRLSVDTAGTNITATYTDGALVLSGLASVRRYQSVLQSLTLTSIEDRSPGSKILVRVEVSRRGQSYEADLDLSVNTNQVLQRRLFHHNANIQGPEYREGYAEDLIHTDKSALLPGQTATAANYTGYTHGINGIVIDLAGDIGSIQAEDFTFRVGNTNDPAQWALAPPPESVVVRPGGGIDGSHRIMLTWGNGVIVNNWLQVTVLANGNTGLAEPDTFYFGNRVGDTGNEGQRAQPQSTEALRLVNLLIKEGFAVLTLNDPLDFDRDGVRSTRDLLAIFNAILANNPPLSMITAPAATTARSGLATPLVSATESKIRIDRPRTTALHDAALLAEMSELWGEEDGQPQQLPIAASLLMEEPDQY